MTATSSPSGTSADAAAQGLRVVWSGREGTPDLREEIPVLGYRDYWYPVIEKRRVPKRRPVHRRLLGDDLCVYRGSDGDRIAVMADSCPHRGTTLSAGLCLYEGTVSCPYHGWTFDDSGECVAVLSEGPQSSIPGKVRVRVYPSVTLKGVVFAWMGAGEPTDPKEDLPPELFDDSLIIPDSTVWNANWRPALENFQDNHAPYIHRNSIRLLLRPFFKVSYTGARPMISGGGLRLSSYQDGTVPSRPYQEYFEGVDGHWPKHTFRRWWAPLFRRWPLRFFAPTGGVDNEAVGRYHDDPEWDNGPHMPGMQRILEQDWYGSFIYTRWCVPIDENTTREFYLHACRIPDKTLALLERRFRHPLVNRLLYYRNFGYQDGRILEQTPYDAPERFSTFDVETIGWRRLAVLSSRYGGRHDKIPPEVVAALNDAAATSADAAADPD